MPVGEVPHLPAGASWPADRRGVWISPVTRFSYRSIPGRGLYVVGAFVVHVVYVDAVPRFSSRSLVDAENAAAWFTGSTT